MATKPVKNTILIRKGTNVGSLDAIHDEDFIQNCFIDNIDPGFVRDMSNRAVLLCGRTGAGKSALLHKVKMQEEGAAILLSPTDLFLDGLGKWNTVKALTSIGINLEPLYKNIWLALIAAEIIRARFDNTDTPVENWWEKRIGKHFKGRDERNRKEALKKLHAWGNGFGDSPRLRMERVITRVEESLAEAKGAAIKADNVGASASLSSATERKRVEEKHLVPENFEQHILQTKIGNITSSEIVSILDLLEECHQVTGQRTYILIDDLDQPWVHDDIRFSMIKALIDAMSQLNGKRSMRAVIAIREDLLDRVLDEVAKSSQQREKYRDYRLELTWSKEQLSNLLERRIEHGFRRQYTSSSVKFYDIFPQKYAKRPTLDYILSRTLMRPRDAIRFVNECLARSESKTQVSAEAIANAEITFAGWMLESLSDEWSGLYSGFDKTLGALKQLAPRFTWGDLLKLDWYEALGASLPEGEGRFAAITRTFFEGGLPAEEYAFDVLKMWYEIGIVGLRLGHNDWFHYRFNSGPRIIKEQLSDSTEVAVSPPLLAAIGHRSDP